MAITNPAGNPAAYPATVERASSGEATTTFWTNTFDPLLNRTAYLWDQLLGATNGLTAKLASQVSTSSGVRLVGAEAHTGSAGQGNYAAQTLFALLAKIWNEKGGLAATNEWTGEQAFSAKITARSRKVLLRTRVGLADSNVTVDVLDADCFILPAAPAAPRVITLDKVGVVPDEGETMVFLCPNLTTGAQPAYTFERNDGTDVAYVHGDTTGDAGAIFVEFEYASGVWRIGANSGSYYDDNTFTTKAGVIPGVGA